MGIIDKLLGNSGSDEKGSSVSDEFEFSRVATHNRNNNNPKPAGDVFPYRPAPAASAAFVNQHRRAHSDLKPMPSVVARPSVVLGDKSATLAAPTPRPTKISIPKLDLSRTNEALLDHATPTPGFEEAPFDFYRRSDLELSSTKGASLPTGAHPPTSPPDLERMLYNQNAFAPYSPSVAGDSSLMDWEKLKKSLKSDQEMITKRISRSFSQSMDGDGSGIESDHFWYKPNFQRIHAEEALKGTPAGSFLVRKSSEQGSYALSVQTKELGLTHLLIKPSMGLWKLQGDTTAVKEFSSVPALIDFYKDQPMPVKGISPFRLR
ncbi:Oidioi.mRNA.OKI2018_I69.XSR.g16371.t1.cds [Oikopleura dioica]|uniref:Oidioi.mRNA.OKI2018_I69.XSR.g16371.t1.cds n=1 Tax=Oikopleura dioica TaxID=34765 RepID=A0ABN7SFW0_OIKDI|nr:Oidioi.mRNA.OKI2018_I69.XSR.g16371.t1.cds [Oikopleura dioica]